AGVIFQPAHISWNDAMARANSLSPAERHKLLQQYLPKRSARWQKVGRAFENAYLRFEIVMDIGSYRDLHRHRMMTQERQAFSTSHGYNVPDELEQSGLAGPFRDALDKAHRLFEKIEPHDPEL